MNNTSSPAVELVVVRHRDGVAIVTMADAPRRNVLAPDMVAQLGAAFDEAESDDHTRCIVLLGEGPAFCAGAELAVLEASASGDFSGIEDVYRGFLRVLESPLPTIAVVNGPAVGAGLNLALACDLRLGTPDAVFDSRFMRLRLVPGGGHTWLLERSVGREAATAMVLFGARLDARQAEAAGLIWQLLESTEEALAAAVELGARLPAGGTEFISAMTRLVRTAPTLPTHEAALDLERYAQRWSTARPQFLDGVRRMRAEVETRRSTH